MPAEQPPLDEPATPTARGRNGEAGFTLLEALVALAILALSFAALFEVYTGGLATVSATDGHLRARLLAQSLMAEVRAGTPNPGALSGRNGDMTWTITTRPADGLSGDVGPQNPWRAFAVEVAVTWPPGRVVRLETVRLGKIR